MNLNYISLDIHIYFDDITDCPLHFSRKVSVNCIAYDRFISAAASDSRSQEAITYRRFLHNYVLLPFILY